MSALKNKPLSFKELENATIERLDNNIFLIYRLVWRNKYELIRDVHKNQLNDFVKRQNKILFKKNKFKI